MRAGEPGDFHEIDPRVVAIATGPGQVLLHQRVRSGRTLRDRRCTAHAGRRRGRFARSLVVDAFSSDAIPLHLLTREAIGLYLSKLSRRRRGAVPHLEPEHGPRARSSPATAREHGLTTWIRPHGRRPSCCARSSSRPMSPWSPAARAISGSLRTEQGWVRDGAGDARPGATTMPISSARSGASSARMSARLAAASRRRSSATSTRQAPDLVAREAAEAHSHDAACPEAPAQAKWTRPTGFSTLPPSGPATPVIDTAKVASRRVSAHPRPWHAQPAR